MDKTEKKTIEGFADGGEVFFSDGTSGICTEKASKFAERLNEGDEVEVGYNRNKEISMIRKAGFVPKARPTGEQRLVPRPSVGDGPDLDFVVEKLKTLEYKIDELSSKLDNALEKLSLE